MCVCSVCSGYMVHVWYVGIVCIWCVSSVCGVYIVCGMYVCM